MASNGGWERSSFLDDTSEPDTSTALVDSEDTDDEEYDDQEQGTDTPGEDSEVDDTEEEDDEEAEESEEDAAIRKLLARYKNDPKELAKALKHAQTKLSRGEHLQGEDRQLSDEVDQQAADTQPDRTIPDTLPPPIKIIPQEHLYDPATDAIDPETGWFLDEENDPAVPTDEFGVPYIPESRWKVRRKELAAEYEGDPIGLQEAWTREVSTYQARQATAYNRIWEAAEKRQDAAAKMERKSIAEKLGKRIPQEEAEALADYYLGEARSAVARVIQKNIESQKAGQRPTLKRTDLVHDHLVSSTLRQVYQTALSEDLVGQHLAEVKTELQKKKKMPMKTGQKPSPGMPPARGSSGASGGRRNRQLSDDDGDENEVVVEVGRHKLTRADKKKYGAKNTVFD